MYWLLKRASQKKMIKSTNIKILDIGDLLNPLNFSLRSWLSSYDQYLRNKRVPIIKVLRLKVPAKSTARKSEFFYEF